MEKAYIILAHKNPSQLLKLVKQLDDKKSTFFLHIDKKVDIQHFEQVTNYSNKVHLVKREYSNWGSLNLVKATINALEAINIHKFFDRIILLSGQDYPVKSNEYINNFYSSADYSVFIEYTTIPDFKRWRRNGGMYRINKYFLGLKRYQKFAARMLNFGSFLMPFLKRKSLNDIIPFAGTQWWTIDDYALKYILNFINANPHYTDFHKYTFAPDEVYFHSILLNSNDEQIAKSISKTSLMYTKWNNVDSSHPEILIKEDLKDILASKRLFARKFEQENDSDTFNLINEVVDQQSRINNISK